MEIMLSPVEVRVLGCLIEKEISTPDYYPLTLNALVNACNQKSNRDPVLALDEGSVIRALDQLRLTHQLAFETTPSASRVPKYKHHFNALWNFPPAMIAILCELFVRGPQTAGDLRARASRLHPLADCREVEELLHNLETREGGPFVVQLPREPGKRERRWAHLFSGEPDLSAEQEPQTEAAQEIPGADLDRIQALETKVALLRQELTELRSAFADLKESFE